MASLIQHQQKRERPSQAIYCITEFFADPRSASGGAAFEFVEIYNGTLDSLILDSCTLSETSRKSGTLFPANTLIPPATFWVLGTIVPNLRMLLSIHKI
jgi:hypothetical protein